MGTFTNEPLATGPVPEAAATLTPAQLATARQCCIWLTTSGLPLNSAIAICGNIAQESKFNPTILGDGGVSFGLIQWQGTRLTNMRTWCAQNGLDPNSLEGQCKFAVVEGPTGDGMGSKWAWLTDTSNGGQPSRSIDTLTADFSQYDERPSAPDLDYRINYAHQVQAYIAANPISVQPTPIPIPIPTPIPPPTPTPTSPLITQIVDVLTPLLEANNASAHLVTQIVEAIAQVLDHNSL